MVSRTLMFGAQLPGFLGLSTDQKPTAQANTGLAYAPGTPFLELDTGNLWTFDGVAQWWQQSSAGQGVLTALLVGISQTLADMSAALTEVKRETRAVRLGVQNQQDAGSDFQSNLYDAAVSIEDAATTTDETLSEY